MNKLGMLAGCGMGWGGRSSIATFFQALQLAHKPWFIGTTAYGHALSDVPQGLQKARQLTITEPPCKGPRPPQRFRVEFLNLLGQRRIVY